MATSAEALAAKIEAKIDRLLEPLVREVAIMKWPPDFQVIIWEAVMESAKDKMNAAVRSK